MLADLDRCVLCGKLGEGADDRIIRLARLDNVEMAVINGAGLPIDRHDAPDERGHGAASAADDAGPPERAADHRRMGRRAALFGQDGVGGDHAVDVVGARRFACKNDMLALVRARLGLFGIAHDDAEADAGRGAFALCQHLCIGARLMAQTGAQKNTHLLRRDARQRLARFDQPFLDHVERDTRGGMGRALGGAALEQKERAAFHREFDVLNVVPLALKKRACFEKLRQRMRVGLAH